MVAIVSKKGVEKGKEGLNQRTPKCVLNGQFVLIIPASIDDTNKSNHSLRATGIFRFYESVLPEMLVVVRSDHISADGVRAYE